MGKDPTLSTGIRTRPPPHRYGVGSIPTSIPDFRNSGMLGTCRHEQKHFYEAPRARKHVGLCEVLLGPPKGSHSIMWSGHVIRSTSTRDTKGQEGGCVRFIAGSVGP